jgi:hypothetical protein
VCLALLVIVGHGGRALEGAEPMSTWPGTWRGGIAALGWLLAAVGWGFHVRSSAQSVSAPVIVGAPPVTALERSIREATSPDPGDGAFADGIVQVKLRALILRWYMEYRDRVLEVEGWRFWVSPVESNRGGLRVVSDLLPIEARSLEVGIFGEPIRPAR